MTKRDKVVMLASALLAVCVMAGAAASLVFSGRAKGSNTESVLMTAGIILICLLSIVAVYFAKVRKGKNEKLLNSDYLREYEIIRDAVANSQLSPGSKREIYDDVLDMLLSAQRDGKAVSDVVGHPSHLFLRCGNGRNLPGWHNRHDSQRDGFFRVSSFGP
jgi:hypothetical protein